MVHDCELKLLAKSKSVSYHDDSLPLAWREKCKSYGQWQIHFKIHRFVTLLNPATNLSGAHLTRFQRLPSGGISVVLSLLASIPQGDTNALKQSTSKANELRPAEAIAS